jgi:hypothetical protein
VSGSEIEFVVVPVRDGKIDVEQGWVYAWVDSDGCAVYVGATGVDPRTRTWLHLHDPDPDVGRMRARFEALADSSLDVLAMRLPDQVSRTDVRDALGARLADESLLAEDAITDHLQLALDPSSEAVELADYFIARLRSYRKHRDKALRDRHRGSSQ